MAEAYKVTSDVSIPQAVRPLGETIDGRVVYETVGRLYAKDDYVLAEEISPDVRERAENGELDHVLEEVSKEEAQEARAEVHYGGQYSTFVPEHSAEQVVLDEYGHETVPRDQALELNAEGADVAREALEAAKEDGADERPLPRGGIEPNEADRGGDDTDSGAKPAGRKTSKKSTSVKSATTTPSGKQGGEVKADAEKKGE